uniref:Uncharacterized protein n=1 Tax=Sinocyclocheilus anshuiensis TaxID=1608454 RepID=A0A671PT60_9TELE
YQSIQNLPIDIQTSNLLDWLVDWRHCTLKWQSAVMTIKEKINAAIQDIYSYIVAFAGIHYCHCLGIIEILKRNRKIVFLYEKDHVYLGKQSLNYLRQFFKMLKLHHLLTNGSFAVSRCRQIENSNS